MGALTGWGSGGESEERRKSGRIEGSGCPKGETESYTLPVEIGTDAVQDLYFSNLQWGLNRESRGRSEKGIGALGRKARDITCLASKSPKTPFWLATLFTVHYLVPIHLTRFISPVTENVYATRTKPPTRSQTQTSITVVRCNHRAQTTSQIKSTQ
ncbi:hypothetical protein C8Q80DRAFT_1123390 [Daedaleopsis nitida]|nr:hypothetical protein C8Q80DRAFT_1123390 [Daedaleopsis nitida]